MRKTKILVTVGPACNTPEMIEKLILTGVNVFRLNFSHSNHKEHKNSLEMIRSVSKKLNKSVGVLQDISGPKIRICELKKPLLLKEGDSLEFFREETEGKVSINHPKVLDSLKVNDLIYLADGTIRVKIVKVEVNKVISEVLVGGELTSKKGVNFPSSKLDIPAITQKDIKDIMFGVENDVDFMALSFVQTPQDVLTAKDIIKSYGKEIAVFAKIEKKDAIENIDAIMDVSDGIMVARGDMGVELGVDKVPKVQKMLIKKANEKGKPVITATQMLTSMMNSPYPTRAEISDVANAVLDGIDAVMLSDETTVGKYPIEAV
jgi:pyruvate kinase